MIVRSARPPHELARIRDSVAIVGRLSDSLVRFGPFRLTPTERLLLEGDKPVRLGSRALDILIALADRAGDHGPQ